MTEKFFKLSSWNSDCNFTHKICWLCLLSQSILLKDSLYVAPMHVLHVILVFNLHCLTLSTINDVFFSFFLHDHHLDLLSLYEPKKLLIIANIQWGPSMISQRNHTGSQPQWLSTTAIIETGFRYDNFLTQQILFPSGFCYVKKNPKRFVILYSNKKISTQPLTFFDLIKPRRKEHLPTQ